MIIFALLFAAVLLQLFLLINTEFTLWPEMAVYPYLINNGFLNYKDIVNPYPPALTYFLAGFSRLFGYQPLKYQFLVWILAIASTLLVFYLTQKIIKNKAIGVVSAVFFVLISLPLGINGLWFELVQTPILLISFYNFYLFLNSKKEKNLFFAYLLLIFSFFIKQQTLWIGILYTLVLLFKVKNKKKFTKTFIKLTAAFIAILAAHLILFLKSGTTSDFLFWVFYFPFVKASSMPGYILLPTIKQLGVILALGLIFMPMIKSKNFSHQFILLAACSMLLFAYPRFEYFHLISFAAILAIGFGILLKNYTLKLNKLHLLSLVGLLIFSAHFIRFVGKNAHQEVRFFERDIYTAAYFVARIGEPQTPIYIQNGPDQIFSIAGKLPSKPWVDEFPWYLEMPGVQDRVVESLESQKPRFIIFKPYENKSTYEIGSYTPTKISSYIDSSYKNLVQINDTLWLKERL